MKKILLSMAVLTAIATSAFAGTNPYIREVTFPKVEPRGPMGMGEWSHQKALLAGSTGMNQDSISPQQMARFLSNPDQFMANFKCQNTEVPYFESQYGKLTFNKSTYNASGIGMTKSADTQVVCSNFAKAITSSEFTTAYYSFIQRAFRTSASKSPFTFMSLFANKSLMKDEADSDFMMYVAFGEFQNAVNIVYKNETDSRAIKDFYGTTDRAVRQSILKNYTEATSYQREKKKHYEDSTILIQHFQAVLDGNQEEITRTQEAFDEKQKNH